MSVAKRASDDRARFGPHGTRGGESFALALDDLAEPMGRRRRPGDDQGAILIVTRYSLGKLDLRFPSRQKTLRDALPVRR
jgi:hypothetical protein